MTGSAFFKMKAKPAKIPTQTFRLDDYGAVGNGIADDTAAFQAMHADILAAQAAKPELRVTVQFGTNKTYEYTDNTWSWGIKYLTLEGNGSSMTNTAGGEWTNAVVWQTNAPAMDVNDPDKLGFLIDTALTGSTSVSLKDVSDASEFAVGKWVLVASYSQQEGGWPPNARNFDYAKVTGISGDTITLDRPLQHNHRDNYPTRLNEEAEIDVARLIPAERDFEWAENWLIKNLTILPNPNWPGGAAVQIEGFNKIVMENVDIFHWTAGQGNELVFRNSNLPSAEPDKLLETITIENSTSNLFFASGVDKLNFINSTSDLFYFAGRHLYVDGSTFNHDGPGRSHDPISIGGNWSVESVEITDSTINGEDHPWHPANKGGWTLRTTIGPGFALDGDDIVVTDSQYFTDGYGHNRMYEGQYLQLEDGSQNPIGYGQVVSITDNGAPNTARLDIDWISGTPVTGNVVAQHNTASYIASNVTLNNTFMDPAWSQDTAYFEWNGVVYHDPLWPV